MALATTLIAPAALPIIVAAIDAPTATVIGALFAGGLALAARLVPRTRPEAARDRAAARFDDAQAWSLQLEASRADNADLRADREVLSTKLITREATLLQTSEALAECRAALVTEQETTARLRAEFAEYRRLHP